MRRYLDEVAVCSGLAVGSGLNVDAACCMTRIFEGMCCWTFVGLLTKLCNREVFLDFSF